MESFGKENSRRSVGRSSAARPKLGARFPATRRIKSREEFQQVFQNGSVAADDVLVVHAIRVGKQSSAQQSKLGLSVSKKVGHAPIRNRWKRLIREAFRTSSEIPGGLLLVVRPKKGATPDFERIRKSLPKLAKKLARKLGG